MKTTGLKFEDVYKYTADQLNQTVMYYGMIEDKYMFIPFNNVKKHFCGIPCVLTESQVNKHISAN